LHNNSISTITTMIDPRFQEEYHAQLQKRVKDLSLAVREKEREALQAKQRREEVGVALYNVQDRLAQNQENICSLEQQCTEAQVKRKESDAKVAALKEEVINKLAERKQMEGLALKSEEGERKNRALLRSLQNRQGEIQQEIELAKRQDSKMKDNTTELEREKSKQDWYVDELEEQVHQLEQKLAMLQSQLAAQQVQADRIKGYIQETSEEVTLVSKEKKKLVQQWNSSLMDLRRRDEALAAARKANQELEERIKDDVMEQRALQTQIRALEQEKEDLLSKQNKLENDSQYVDEQIAQTEAKQARDAEQYSQVQASMEVAKTEEVSYVKEKKALDREIKALEHKIELLAEDRRGIEQKMHECYYNEKSVDSTTDAMKQREQKLERALHKNEVESTKETNKLARLQVRRLNLEANIASLDEKINEEESQISCRKEKIKQRQAIISQNHLEIEKKTRKAGELNKKYQILVDSYGGKEPLGPLEATIKSSNKSIDQEQKKIQALQREWLKAQVDVVKTIQKCQEMDDANAEKSSKLTILQNKKLRLENEVRTYKAEIGSLTDSIKGKQRDIGLLNGFIDEHGTEETDLQQKTKVKEKEYKAAHQQMRQDDMELEKRLCQIEQNSQAIAQETVETEQKIQAVQEQFETAKKTKLEVTTSVCVKQIQGMTNEIHNMKKDILKYEREYEELVQDVKQAICRREEIRQKYEGKSGRNSSVLSDATNVMSEQIMVPTRQERPSLLTHKRSDSDNRTRLAKSEQSNKKSLAKKSPSQRRSLTTGKSSSRASQTVSDPAEEGFCLQGISYGV
jgi:chromosome segregation ATPase